MGIIRTILLVMVQNDDSNGMGSAFGGQSAAFGSHSASVLTKTTGVLVGLFFVTVFSLALFSRTSKGDDGLSATANAVEASDSSEAKANGSWVDDAIKSDSGVPSQEMGSAQAGSEDASAEEAGNTVNEEDEMIHAEPLGETSPVSAEEQNS